MKKKINLSTLCFSCGTCYTTADLIESEGIRGEGDVDRYYTRIITRSLTIYGFRKHVRCGQANEKCHTRNAPHKSITVTTIPFRLGMTSSC